MRTKASSMVLRYQKTMVALVMLVKIWLFTIDDTPVTFTINGDMSLFIVRIDYPH